MRLSSDRAARRRLGALGVAALAALALGMVAGAGHGDGDRGVAPRSAGTGSADGGRPSPSRVVASLTLRRQVGQLLLSSFDEATLPDYLARRLRAQETAGVILFGRNVGAPGEVRRLTGPLQRAARGSALVAVDQEGGSVRTLPWAGPAPAQSAQGPPDAVERLAAEAARELRAAGVNVDLAPVADVALQGSALADRAFPGGSADVAARVRAAVRGYASGGVASTPKHFPGLGGAARNTDDAPVTAALVPGALEPFRAAIAERAPLVMASHALYPELDARRIASQSPAVLGGLLRRELDFRGVIVTDSMEAQAVLARSGLAAAAERSVAAGADLLLLTGSASWGLAFPRLLARAQRDPGFRARVRASAARVVELKRRLELRAPG